MANYLDETYLSTVFPEQDLIDLTDDDGDGEIDPAVLASAIAAAEGEFHGYVAARYQTPLDLADDAEMAETVRGILVTLLAHKLWSPPRRTQMPESVRLAYRDAIDWLRGVSRGEITLGGASAPDAGGQSPRVYGGSETRRVTHTKLRGL